MGTPNATGYAAEGLGTVLNSYTVYRDSVICDGRGKVIANGHPCIHKSIGRDVSSAKWFTGATATRLGKQFAYASAKCELADSKPSLI